MEIEWLIVILCIVLILALYATYRGRYENMDKGDWATILAKQGAVTKLFLTSKVKKNDCEEYARVIKIISDAIPSKDWEYASLGTYAAMLFMYTDGVDKSSKFNNVIATMQLHNVPMKYNY